MQKQSNEMQTSVNALGVQSQQILKGASEIKAHKSPPSYMSEDNAPAYKTLEQKKIKFYAQIESIKETRLIENLASLKSKAEKQKCIDSFAEIYESMLKNVIEISDTVKQTRFNEPTTIKASSSNLGLNHLQTGSTNNNAQAPSSVPANNLPNQDRGQNININDTKIEIQDLPDQIIKDCKSIHNIYADLVQDSSLKHLELCCETFTLDGSAVNLKFKISSWYNEIKDHVERYRPLAQANRNAKKGSTSRSSGCFLCPCLGSKQKPKANQSTSISQQQINRNNTNMAIQNQRTTLDPNI